MHFPAVFALLLVWFALPATAQRSPWEGTWSTQFGEVVLRQDGTRVWGDYVNERGVIEARMLSDGTLRGTFLRGDQRWGFFEFRQRPAARGWDGVYQMQDLPRRDGQDPSWNATERVGPANVLRFAVTDQEFWPPAVAGLNDLRFTTYLGLGAPSPSPQPVPAPQPPPNIAVALSEQGEFTIRSDRNGAMLGKIIVDTVDFGMSVGSGDLFALPSARDVTPFSVHIVNLTREALELELTFPNASGLPPAVLLVDRAPAGAEILLQGTLIRGPAHQQQWELVTLDWTGPSADDPLFDAPGFGVYALPFGLRNTSGASVGLRERPRSDAQITNTLAPEVADLWITECTPDVDGLSWEQAGAAARLAMLDGVWCNVARENLPIAQGWVPGFFLAPR